MKEIYPWRDRCWKYTKTPQKPDWCAYLVIIIGTLIVMGLTYYE